MNLRENLSIVDIANFVFWLAILLFYLLTFQESVYKLQAGLLLAGLLIFQLTIIFLRGKTNKNLLTKLLLLLYPIVYLVVIFDSLHMVLTYINPNIYDEALYNLDKSILGVNPTVWIEQFINPYLTEFMYYLYLFYFPMPLLILGYLYKNKMFKALDKSILFLFITYYGSYLLYFVVPALGPRFYEPLVQLQQVPLDGLYFTDVIRDTISSLEHNKFDAFPSLHTAIALAVTLIVAQYRKKWLYFFIPVTIGIFISLIYCRYHYFVDMIGGVVWTLISFWFVNKFYDQIFAKKYIPFYNEK
jgi:membrane-associated phospholipid phosphatase